MRNNLEEKKKKQTVIISSTRKQLSLPQTMVQELEVLRKALEGEKETLHKLITELGEESSSKQRFFLYQTR